jgi:hypothetical protein
MTAYLGHVQRALLDDNLADREPVHPDAPGDL